MIILAPMQGLTEVMFRKAYEQCFPGAIDLAVSPFLSLTHGNLADAWKKIGDVLPEANQGSMPVVPQILGKEPEEFVELANRLHEIGYDEVNWNIGCPMRKVAHKHRGSGILPYPDEIDSILSAIEPHLKPRLSVKMRLGYHDENEIDRIIPILNQHKIKNITIHPRIGKQIYSGKVNLDKLEAIIGDIKHKVIYNGDITTLDEYKAMRQQFPQIEDVMIGRGILYDPTLPLAIKGEPIADNGMKRFVATLMDAIMARPISDNAKWRKIKEYWCMLSHSMTLDDDAKKEVLHATTLAQTIAMVEKCMKLI